MLLPENVALYSPLNIIQTTVTKTLLPFYTVTLFLCFYKKMQRLAFS